MAGIFGHSTANLFRFKFEKPLMRDEADMAYATKASQTSDVTGPSSAVDGEVTLFDGITGKLIKSAGVLFSLLSTKAYADAAVAVETTARGIAVTAEASTRATADTTEATARAAADTTESTARASADTTEATARAAADTAAALINRIRIAVSSVDMKTAATTAGGSTANNGKRFIPEAVIIECTAATSITIVGTLSVGTNGGVNDILAATAATGVTTANLVLQIPIVAAIGSIAPNTAISTKVTIAATGTSQVVNVYVTGYYAA